ncbi:MAG TPA: GspE/PulE family protein [Planctomycetota bacterium]|nr:GspE/PulE family protein [Planctomycetota bacterium]
MTSELLDMDRVRIDPAWALRVPAQLALRRLVLPFALFDGRVHVACADPSDATAFEAVERFTGQKACPALAERTSLLRALQRIFGDAPRAGPSRSSTRLPVIGANGRAPEVTEDAVTLSEDILRAAIIRQASDIHIEPGRANVRVRFRVDGQLEEYMTLPLSAEMGLISRLKVRSGMDIAEKRAPQDGGFNQRIGGTAVVGENPRGIDVRVATLPTKFGERMTLRLLGLQTGTLTLEKLGMAEADLRRMETVLDQPHGLVLLTGPTGSGKTTTLYAAIQRLLQQSALNIITVEDPIEYELPGVSQVEVDTAEKVNFTKALRSLLRHDPDVVMIGEIRDPDTLDVAIKSALTGHLVLSTLHTNGAAAAITRLSDMGLEPFMSAATLRLSAAQRLVRRLCAHCRKPRALSEAEAAALGDRAAAGRTVFEPGACVYCAGKGYAGRVGLFELLPMDADFAGMIGRKASEAELTAAMKARKVPLLIDDAREKIFAGETTVRETLQAVTVW